MNSMHRISQAFATLCVALFARSAMLGYVKEQQALKFENEEFGSRLYSANTKEAMAFLEKRLPDFNPISSNRSSRWRLDRHGAEYNTKRQQQRSSEEHARIVGLRRSEFSGKSALVQFPWRCSRLARRDHLVGIDICSHRTRCERR